MIEVTRKEWFRRLWLTLFLLVVVCFITTHFFTDNLEQPWRGICLFGWSMLWGFLGRKIGFAFQATYGKRPPKKENTHA